MITRRGFIGGLAALMVGGGSALLRIVEPLQERFIYRFDGPKFWQFDGPSFGTMDLKFKSMASLVLACDSGIACDEAW